MPDRLITHLRHVDLAVPDLDLSRGFFSDTWGLSVVGDDGDVSYLVAEGSTEPYIMRLRSADEKRVDIVAFGSKDRADVDALAAQLGSADVTLVSEPGRIEGPGGGYGFRFFDSEGRTLEVTSDVDTRVPREVGVGENIPVKLSHVVLNSAQPEASVDFYVDQLGFAVSDILTLPGMGNLMWFLRCNSQHHSIAIVRCMHPSLHHLSFEMRGLNEYLLGTGRVKRAGTELVWGPGRHLAGDNAFSYFLDPVGNTVEYTTEMDVIDEATWVPHEYSLAMPNVADQWGTANPMGPDVAAKSFNTPDRGMFVAPPR